MFLYNSTNKLVVFLFCPISDYIQASGKSLYTVFCHTIEVFVVIDCNED